MKTPNSYLPVITALFSTMELTWSRFNFYNMQPVPLTNDLQECNMCKVI